MAEDEQVAAVPRNTPDQLATIKRAEERWEAERQQPLWEVQLQGDEAVWAARPATNLATEDTTVALELDGAPAVLGTDSDGKPVYKLHVRAGDPMPWVATATASVQCRAATEDQARARALMHNLPDYHTVVSCKQLDDGGAGDGGA